VDTNGPLQLQKRGQLFVCAHDEPVSIAAMSVSNPHRACVGIQSGYAAPTPSVPTEIVSGNFQILHALPDNPIQLCRNAPYFSLAVLNGLRCGFAQFKR
jgi:hypothetical protein